MFKHYLSLVKFSHTIFALPFALIGLFLGLEYIEQEGISPDKPWYITLLWVIGCMVTARNAAMGFNRYADRTIDAENARTATREIPAGIISANQALVFIWANVAAFIGFAWLINLLCFALSPIALIVILGYSYTKRFTPLCHLVLGLGLALAPVGAFLAVTGEFAWPPIVLGFVVFTWVSGFDIIYALQDESFDREKGLYSIPTWLGGKGALRFSEGLHVLTAIGIGVFGLLVNGSLLFALGSAIFIGLLVYQHTLVKVNDLTKINLAFGTTNGVASVIYALFTISSWIF